jgi:hypothetical protein
MTTEPSHKIKNLLISLAVLAAVGVAVWAALSLDPTGQRGAGTGRNYEKEFQKLKKFDLSLVKWAEVLPAIPTKMESPVAMAVFSNGDICIGGDKVIAILSPDGREIKRIDAATAPQALAIADKTIFAASQNAVTVLDTEGQTQAQWSPLDDNARIVSLGVSDEYVYAADAGNRVVVRYDRKTGKRTFKDGRSDSGAFMSGFNVPSPHLDLAVTPEGQLLTVDPGRSLVQIRDNYGDILKSWGSEGSHITKFYGCCNPAAIAVLDDKKVVTYEKTLQRVKIYSLEGELAEVAAGPNEFTDQPADSHIACDIAVDRDGRILVLDPIRKTVRIFKRKIAPRPTTGAAR